MLEGYLKMDTINRVFGPKAVLIQLTEHAVEIAAAWIDRVLDNGLAALSLAEGTDMWSPTMARAVVSAFAAGRQQFLKNWEALHVDSSLRELLHAMRLQMTTASTSFSIAVLATKDMTQPSLETIAKLDEVNVTLVC